MKRIKSTAKKVDIRHDGGTAVRHRHRLSRQHPSIDSNGFAIASFARERKFIGPLLPRCSIVSSVGLGLDATSKR